MVTLVTLNSNAGHIPPKNSPLKFMGKRGAVYNINQEKCKKVADCAKACPMRAIERKSDGTFSVSDDCTDCGACEPVCDAKAIQQAQ